MLIEDAVKSMTSVPGGWVRVEKVRRLAGGVEISFAVHKGKRGRRIDAWSFGCLGLLEADITDLDGGGIAVDDCTHPAARQYVARQGELRWRCDGDETVALGVLYQAHVETVDDWIPFDRYAYPTRMSEYAFDRRGHDLWVRGPDFLLRAYAKALRARGEHPRLILRAGGRPKSVQPKVLHFGESYVVAATFAAQRHDENEILLKGH
jgi:hypothetical protein